MYFIISIHNSKKLDNQITYEVNSSVGGDAHHYLVIAKNLLDHKQYSDTNSSTISEGSTWRPPVWPFILSILLLFSKNLFSLLVLKVVMETFLIFFFYRTLKRRGLFKRYYLLFLLLIEPQILKYSYTFLSESITALWIFILLTLFLSLNKNKRMHIAIPIVLAVTILCHPVSIFFILTLFLVYVLINMKKNFKKTAIHIIVFLGLVSLWPIRNQVVFNKGFFITTSQGATFSKGWNESVFDEFNNVNGDLANEGMNLKYLSQERIKESSNSPIDRSKLYKEATILFLKQTTLMEKIKIMYVKVRSNFNPFPEVPKEDNLEYLSSFFRVLYLILFFQVLFFLGKERRINLDQKKSKVAVFVLTMFIGQLLMSLIIYTGLRFNSIYGLSLLACFYLFNEEYIDKLLSRIKLQ
tara:strand:+ start:2062 stop:3294 length:1233 start_codon:yes stop_codon:yes gene_type:complete